MNQAADAYAAFVAAQEFGLQPVQVGTIGGLRIYASRATHRLGRPHRRRRLFVAVCMTGPCSARTTATLRITPAGGTTIVRRVSLGSLSLQPGTAGHIVLRINKANGDAIRAARRARLTVRITSATGSYARRFRFHTGG